MGMLYKPKYKTADGTIREVRVWWMKYYMNGRPVRESTETEKEKAAARILKAREGRVASGAPLLPRVDKIRYEEITEDLRQHYEATGCRDLEEADYRLAHLKRFFAGRRVAAIGPADVTTYVVKRQEQGASNGTINRELATLRRALRLAYEAGKLLRLPVIRQLKENGPRQGFFEREQFEAVTRALPEELRPVVEFAYLTGWRIPSEVLTLTWAQVDVAGGEVRLEPGTTKNDEARTFPLTPELRALLEAQRARTEVLQRSLGRIIPWVFSRRGTPILDFRGAWATACKLAGCPGRIPHDFRRSAIRNMIRAGVQERVAMKLSGHKSRAVFDRYNIVSEEDLRDAARKLAGINPGIVAPEGVDRRRVTS